MKKLLCIALIVLLASPIFSQWLGFEFQFETGMANGKFGEIETDQDREYLSLYNFEVTYIELSPYFWFLNVSMSGSNDGPNATEQRLIFR